AYLKEGCLYTGVASGPWLPRLSRSGLAAADGLLVPVGFSGKGVLHLPLLGEPLCVEGAEAGGLVASLLLSAGLRAGGEDLRLLSVGEADGLLSMGSFSIPEADLPGVERVLPDHEQAVLEELRAEMERRSRLFVEAGADGIREYLLHEPDQLVPAILVVVEESRAARWLEALERASHLGIGVIVVGAASTPRRLVVEAGRCRVDAAPPPVVESLEAFVLPPQALEELVARATENPSPPSKLQLTPDAQSGGESHLPSSPVASIHCLGALEVRRGGTVADPPNRADAVELLAFLAAHPEGASSDVLLETLRPGADPARMGVHVRRWASDARLWLHGNTTNTPVLRKANGRYRLVLDNVWVDALAFRESLRRAEGSEAPEVHLRRAVALYRGEFCADLGLPWGEHIREEYRRLFRDAALKLARLEADSGKETEALEILERAQRANPYDEEVARRAMAVAASQDSKWEVLRWFQRLKRVYLEDLGLEPSPETYRLFHSIIQGDLSRAGR
ncbi:MAG: AfsR/SARP family transcriptional regulator, partial [Candidatus Methylomirabilales bacterium]